MILGIKDEAELDAKIWERRGEEVVVSLANLN